MSVIIGADIAIYYPSSSVLDWCKKNLVIPNPDYNKKKRMGFSTYRTPDRLVLYEKNGATLRIPYGCLDDILPFIDGPVSFKCQSVPCEYHANIPLYDYQQTAVSSMRENGFGILQSAAGSGKTQMGLALAVSHKQKALWITHTKDLLNQSYNRAKQYISENLLGKITEGKVEIEEGITFATVQTLANLDLIKYRYEWNVIIVDECHRVSGTPTTVTRFYKVLSNLCARHKYGLSATVHRSDGLIRATTALLGPVAYRVPDEAVQKTVMPVTVLPIQTGVTTSREMLNGDGTLNYQSCVSYLTRNASRNQVILEHLKHECYHYNLILSDRVAHLKTLSLYLKVYFFDDCVKVLTGSTPKKEREEILERARNGKIHFLLSTYSLAKEGLDIPRLDRLHLVTPQKDYAIVTQSIGRIARRFPGKKDAIVYDYVDNTRWHERAWKTRCRHYRKSGVDI